MALMTRLLRTILDSESVALLDIDSSQYITRCCLLFEFTKTANGLYMMIPEHRGAFFSMLSQLDTIFLSSSIMFATVR